MPLMMASTSNMQKRISIIIQDPATFPADGF
jgi:hypothetical protein